MKPRFFFAWDKTMLPLYGSQAAGYAVPVKDSRLLRALDGVILHRFRNRDGLP